MPSLYYIYSVPGCKECSDIVVAVIRDYFNVLGHTEYMKVFSFCFVLYTLIRYNALLFSILLYKVINSTCMCYICLGGWISLHTYKYMTCKHRTILLFGVSSLDPHFARTELIYCMFISTSRTKHDRTKHAYVIAIYNVQAKYPSVLTSSPIMKSSSTW